MLEPATVERFTRQARSLSRSDYLDAEALMQLREIRDAYDQALADAVAKMAAEGESWSTIGRGLGMSRQQAHRKYGRSSENLEAPAV